MPSEVMLSAEITTEYPIPVLKLSGIRSLQGRHNSKAVDGKIDQPEGWQ